jgi:hypothetical protein
MGDEWVSFDDGETDFPDRLLFESRIFGGKFMTADCDISATCTYILFY